MYHMTMWSYGNSWSYRDRGLISSHSLQSQAIVAFINNIKIHFDFIKSNPFILQPTNMNLSTTTLIFFAIAAFTNHVVADNYIRRVVSVGL